MDAKPIPFGGQQGSLEELGGAPSAFINASLDSTGAISARAGITRWSSFPSTFPSARPVNMVAIVGDNLVYTTDDGYVWAWLAATGQVKAMSSAADPTSILDGSDRPSFAVNHNVMIIAAGGVPQKVDAYGLTTSRLLGDPPNARDVSMLTQRIILVQDDDSGIFAWSDVGDTGTETWDAGLEFREAEARPDPLLAGKETAREYWAFGTRTLQVFVPDDTQTFAPQTALDVGCGALRSPIRREAAFAWLDDNRRIVWCDGRQVGPDNIISSPPLTRTIEGLSTVDDCWGYREKIGNNDSFVFTFPTEGRTFTYDIASQSWSERYCFRDGQWQPYCVTAYVYWPERNLHVVGLTDGTLAVLSNTAYTDLGYDLKWVARSGFIDQGMPMMKEPIEAQIRMRRGQATSASSVLSLRWRDDLGGYSSPVNVDVGMAGDNDHTEIIRPAGLTYRARQWELSSTAADVNSVAKIIETFEELDS